MTSAFDALSPPCRLLFSLRLISFLLVFICSSICDMNFSFPRVILNGLLAFPLG